MMAGPIGATTGKFVLMAAALLLHGRVDGQNARIAIAPGAPTSAISAALAERIKPHAGDTILHIHLRAETIDAKIEQVEPELEFAAELRIGQDVLNDNPIEIDFRHHVLQPLSQSEARRLERHARAVAIRREANGTLSVDVAAGHQPSVSARLDMSSDLGFATPNPPPAGALAVGGVALPGVDISSGPQPILGLGAFGQTRVIFDLAHDRIWVDL
jgi:hypothetical protein